MSKERKMSKVYIGLDSFYLFFLWDEKVLNILDPKSEQFDTIEVPQELIEQYEKLMFEVESMNERLKWVYDEKLKVQKPL